MRGRTKRQCDRVRSAPGGPWPPGRSSTGETAGRPPARAPKESLTGLARIARLGPAFCQRIPIKGLHLARDLGQPCAIFARGRPSLPLAPPRPRVSAESAGARPSAERARVWGRRRPSPRLRCVRCGSPRARDGRIATCWPAASGSKQEMSSSQNSAYAGQSILPMAACGSDARTTIRRCDRTWRHSYSMLDRARATLRKCNRMGRQI